MSSIKKSKTSASDTPTPLEQQQLSKARSRKSQATRKTAPTDGAQTTTGPKTKTETAITPTNPTAVTSTAEQGQTEELKTESVQQQEYVQSDLEAARRLGVQLALAERQNDEVAFAAFQQTKALIEEELGSAPRIFRRYSDFQSIDLNQVATEQFDAAGLQFSANADLSALAERLLQPPAATQDSVA